MTIDQLTGETWRFDVVNHAPGSEPTIYRARLYQMPADWAGDSWQFYWDGDQMAAVYDNKDYRSPTKGAWTERAEHVVNMCREYGQDLNEALTRLAVRLFDHEAPGARFVTANVDRGVDLYALSWAGDPDRTWANEIEAVACGDIWRVEVEEYNSFTESWSPADEVEEWYGQSVAEAEFVKAYPLEAFPAEQVIGQAVGA